MPTRISRRSFAARSGENTTSGVSWRVPFSKEVRDVLWQDPFGENVFPRRARPPFPAEDGRTVALRTLRRYLADLTFYRAGGKDDAGERLPPIPFQIPAENIHLEWPDNEAALQLPAIALLAQGPGEYDSIGVMTNVDEESQDQIAPGTVVNLLSELQENFVLEIWSATKQHRRALRAGIEQALSPFEQMAGLRFRMPDYYNQLACFALQSCEIVDDEEAVRIRRRARMVIELRYNVCALVNVSPMQPQMTALVDADDDGSPIEPDEEAPPSNCGGC